MALIWRKDIDGVRYEVRSAGRSRRLYTDGVFHSQHHPEQLLTGTVWDRMLLAAFLAPPGSVRRVLVLGVGGGTVIRQLRRFVAPERIVGVELNPVHLALGRRFFALSGAELELHRADARQWLHAYDGPPFDLIIEDLYGEHAGEPQRAVAADRHWFATLRRHLSAQGVLAMNFVHIDELAASAYYSNRRVAGAFASVFRLDGPVDHNAVAVFTRRSATSRELRRRLESVPELDPRRKTGRLSYRIRKI